MTAQKPPRGLGPAGRRFWREVATDDLVMGPDESRLLEAASRCLDELAVLEAELATAPTMVPGSAGQMRANPLFNELRLHRALLAQLCRQLAIPTEDDDRSAALQRSAAGRALVRQRWDR